MKKILLSIVFLIFLIPSEKGYSNTIYIGDPANSYTLSGLWYYIPEDTPANNAANADLSKWDKVQINKNWQSYKEYSNYYGISWYRINIHAGKKLNNYALLIPLQPSSCEIFFNESLIYSSYPPNKRGILNNKFGKPNIVPIPNEMLA